MLFCIGPIHKFNGLDLSSECSNLSERICRMAELAPKARRAVILCPPSP